jgi:uncharacterized protein YihD (DUF1040 family)
MKWHKGTDLPNIETDTQLCVVQYKYPVCEDERFANSIYELYYDVMLFHKKTKSFSKQDDLNGINGLRPDLVVRWAYIEEDDDIIEEEQALESISAAVSHVKNLIQLLLTDCIATPKDYREKIGLDDLFAFDKKIAQRKRSISNFSRTIS